jgi:hypothetical protein
MGGNREDEWEVTERRNGSREIVSRTVGMRDETLT